MLNADVPEIYDVQKRRFDLALKIVKQYLKGVSIVYDVDELSLARHVYLGLGEELEKEKMDESNTRAL